MKLFAKPTMTLPSLSPVWQLIEDPVQGHGVVVAFDMSATAVMRLGGVDMACKSSEDLGSLSLRLKDAISASPAGFLARTYSVELQPYARELQAFEAQFEQGSFARHLARKKAEQCLATVAPRRREIFLALSTPAVFKTTDFSSGSLRGRTRQLQQTARRLIESKLRELRLLLEQWSYPLRSVPMDVEILGTDGLYDVMWRLANPMRSMLFDPPSLRREMSLRSQLFLSGLTNGVDYYRREGHVHRVVTLRVLPESVFSGCVRALQGFSFPHVVTVNLRRIDSHEAEQTLEKIRSRGFELRQTLAKYRGQQKSAENEDHRLVGQQRDANEMLVEIQRHGDALCDMSMQVVLSAQNDEELDRHTEKVLSAIRSMGRAEGAIEEHRARFAFLGTLPGHHTLIGDRYLPILASRAADLLPVFRPASGSLNPTYLMTTAERTLFGWDPLDRRRSSNNAIVTGSTGHGKSVTVRLLQLGHIARGGRAVIVTRGTDYHRYAELLDGEAYDLCLDDDDLALGPFFKLDDVSHSSSVFRHRMAHLRSIIAVMGSDGDNPLDHICELFVFRALQRLYERTPSDKAPTFSGFVEDLTWIRRDETHYQSTLDTLITRLRFWVEGPYAHVFCRNRAPIARPLTVWNLEPLESHHAQRVVLATLSGIIGQSVSLGPTVITLDECWSILQHPAGLGIVMGLYRTVRKSGSCVCGVSQSIGDWLSLPEEHRNGILNNAPIQAFLKTNTQDEVDQTAKCFKLNETEKKRLENLVAKKGFYSDLLLAIGNERHMLQIPTTGVELWATTSDKHDLDLERRFRAALPRHSCRAITKALGKAYPHGAAACAHKNSARKRAA